MIQRAEQDHSQPRAQSGPASRETPTPESSALLHVRGLTKRFGATTALDDVDLVVREGEILTLLGPSGSGKTTLLRLVAGFEKPTQGDMLLRGRDIGRLTPAERGIGMVFQHYSLFPHMTVAQNLEYPLKLRRWSKTERRQRVMELLELVRLPALGARHIGELSGGQQQRIALARAISFRPELLLMDEPLGALDRLLRLEMEEEIRRLHRELRTTIVTVTHDQQEALALSDRIAIMREGRIAGLDSPEALYYTPSSDFVAGFFSHANVLAVVVEERLADGKLRVSCGRDRFTMRAPVTEGELAVAVRPSAFRQSPPQEGDYLTVDGIIRESILLGSERELTVEADGLGLVKALADALSSTSSVGRPIKLYCAVSDMNLVTVTAPQKG